MKTSLRLLSRVLAVTGAALSLSASVRADAGAPTPPLLLVSMDGFRWDYLEMYPAETPHLQQYAAEGISARELIPVYPSNTFPNHYTIVTGLYPAHHGIINNEVFDPKFGELFHYNRPQYSGDGRWWGGEPIWITAVKQGRRSASYYWVGAEAEIEGARPTYYKHFDAAVYASQPFDVRIEQVVQWLKLPPDQRPAIITFYLEETNSAGHKFGPGSPELGAAVKLLDGRLGALMDRLKAEHLPVNLIVVSDHGMTPVSPDRVVILDDYVDLKTVQMDFETPQVGLHPLQGTARELWRHLAGIPHAKVYLADNEPAPAGLAGWVHALRVDGFERADYLPARFHLTGNPRIPPVWIVPDLGWVVETRASSKIPGLHDMKGNHGFDNADRDMHGTLIADGPSFKTGGGVIDPVANIHIYNLMCAALRLTPAPNDGDDRLVHAMLR